MLQLHAVQPWPATSFHQHHGNADVIRQALQRAHGINVSLRTVERAVAPLRFETRPGEQLQIDFCERTVENAGVKERTYVFVATLGYSRRVHVRVFRLARRDHVAEHELTFHPRLLAFAQRKGKDDRVVGHVKHNALAGHRFASFAAMEAHVEQWTREVADVRVHGTTGEAPLQRFARDEATRLARLASRPGFQSLREWMRRVQVDCTVELHRNWYSVPWRYLGETVRVQQ